MVSILNYVHLKSQIIKAKPGKLWKQARKKTMQAKYHFSQVGLKDGCYLITHIDNQRRKSPNIFF